MIVLPAELAETVVVSVVKVPEPLAAKMVMEGEAARFVSVPPEVDFSWACQV